MLVGRKNCRKIVQFLVEPLIKKQSISPTSEWIFFLFIQIGLNIRRLQGSLFVYSISLASDELELQTVFRYDSR